MKRKRTFALILILVLMFVMLAGLLTGCSYGVKGEPVEIFINVPILTVDCIANPEFENSDDFIKAAWDMFAAQYTKYNVRLRNDRVSVFEQTNYQANIPDKYNTQDCPDLTFGAYFAMSGYIYDGYVIPLDDVVTDTIREDFSYATWKQSMGSNGRIYLLPFYALQNILCYNKELFYDCGLDAYVADTEEIQGWSLEEWDFILSTLERELPDYHYPMMMYAKNNQGDTHIMVQLRCKGSDFFDENGLFHLNTEEGIAGLQWLRDNYDKGYYPFQCEDLDISDNVNLFLNGQLAIYTWNSSIASNLASLDLGYVNFPGVDDHGTNTNWLTGFMAFDNGDEKKIEVVKDFLRFIYETDELMDYSTSGYPCARSVALKWQDEMTLGKQLVENDVYAVDFTGNNPNWAGVRQVFWPHIHALLTGAETAEEAALGLDTDCNNAINSVQRTLHE